jgi:hypothetical protein
VLNARGDTLRLPLEQSLILVTHTLMACSGCYVHINDTLEAVFQQLGLERHPPIILVSNISLAQHSALSRRMTQKTLKALMPLLDTVLFLCPECPIPDFLSNAFSRPQPTVLFYSPGTKAEALSEPDIFRPKGSAPFSSRLQQWLKSLGTRKE